MKNSSSNTRKATQAQVITKCEWVKNKTMWYLGQTSNNCWNKSIKCVDLIHQTQLPMSHNTAVS